jgi:hypothetical protein
MKRTCLFLSVMLCIGVAAMAQSGSVGIGTTTPNASAALDIQSTSKGVLVPRMTTAQRNAISNRPPGYWSLIILPVPSGLKEAAIG